LMRRKGDHTEGRLSNMYSLGIGGHINEKDIKVTKVTKGKRRLWSGRGENLKRKLNMMEITKTEFLGLLNHDANDVGLVHMGLVIRVIGDSDKIAIRDEHKSGKLVSLEEIGRYYQRMETWSQIVYDFLMAKNKKTQISRRCFIGSSAGLAYPKSTSRKGQLKLPI